MVGGWQSPEAGDGEWEDSSLKGAEGAAACCSRRGAVAISEHGKLYDMIMRSRFIMHERSGRGAPLDTGPLFLARTARALSS